MRGAKFPERAEAERGAVIARCEWGDVGAGATRTAMLATLQVAAMIVRFLKVTASACLVTASAILGSGQFLVYPVYVIIPH